MKMETFTQEEIKKDHVSNCSTTSLQACVRLIPDGRKAKGLTELSVDVKYSV